MVLCFMPDAPGIEDACLAVMRAIPPDHARVVERTPLTREQWIAACRGVHAVIVWVLCSDQAFKDNALTLLATASQQGIPTVAVGASLDRDLAMHLTQLPVNAYVAVRRGDRFAAALASALTEAIRAPQTTTHFYNIDLELVLRVLTDSITWVVGGGGYDDDVSWGRATTWARTMLDDLARSRSRGLKSEDIQRIGAYMGAFILPDASGHRFYASVQRVASETGTPRVLVVADEAWSVLPFEAASLPLIERRLGVTHPTVRLVHGAVVRQRWHPPIGRGLRVLLIGANPRGQATCPRGLQCTRVRGLRHVTKEIEVIERILLGVDAQKRGLLQHVETIVGKNATREVVRARIASQTWDVIHYAGHGAKCRRPGEPRGCLYFSKDHKRFWARNARPNAVPIEWCLSVLATQAPESLVYLSCCHSGDNGLLRLLAAGKPCEVVGYQFGVDDRAACKMAECFYSELLQGIIANRPDVDSAMLLARQAIAAGNEKEWLAGALSSLWIGDNRVP